MVLFWGFGGSETKVEERDQTSKEQKRIPLATAYGSYEGMMIEILCSRFYFSGGSSDFVVLFGGFGGRETKVEVRNQSSKEQEQIPLATAYGVLMIETLSSRFYFLGRP